MLEQLRAAYRAACEALKERQEAVETSFRILGEATEGTDLEPLTEAFDSASDAAEEAVAEVNRTKENLRRAERAASALEDNPIPEAPEHEQRDRIVVGKEEPTYQPGKRGAPHFATDILLRKEGDQDARDRLQRNRLEGMEHYGLEERDMSSTLTAGGDFLPPLYLGSLAVEPNIAGRPFANAVPKLPLPPLGTSISIPSFASGVTVETRADGGTVSETDGVTAEITHDVNEIAGQVDIGRIVVMRSDPSLDEVVVRTLRRRYDAKLDTQLIAGTGTAPQHRGIRVVVGANAVTYTDASPTSAELYPKIFDAAQQIATNRLEVFGDTVLLHPRRSAWLAKELSTSFPLFQYGNLNQAGGTQSGGFARDLSGLSFILDPNIPTTLGASTNEDEIYVLAIEDFILMEGPLMVKVFEDVGSGEGKIRYQVFAVSAFLSKRYPKSISIISGTGLAAPTF